MMKYLLFLILFFQIQNLKSEITYKNIWLVLVSQIYSTTSEPKDAFKSHYVSGPPYETKQECNEELDNILVQESK